MHEGVIPPYLPLYPMSVTEFEALQKYLEAAQSKGWIQKSTSPAGAPILFAKKADRGLHLCVDYRGLNEMTSTNRYPLPQIDELIDRVTGTNIFTKLDLRDVYHRIRIRRGDKWKTADLPAYINEAMKGILDIYCIVYLDDILIYSQNEQEHREHVSEVLRRLAQHQLYAKLSKCEFHREEVNMEKGRKRGAFELSSEARTAFHALKEAFVNSPILIHFDPGKQIIVHMDVSKVAVVGILMQSGDAELAQPWLNDYHPVAYFSKKLNPAQRNYDTHD
ncbi:hypothetical protein VTO42DRAFT_2640 [Malbranchea cinnamomea]